MANEPVLTETSAGVTIRWFCMPPPKGPVFIITDQAWDKDFNQRDIYAWEFPPAPARERLLRRINCSGFWLQVIAWDHDG
jgi:hypothetical protein